MSWQHLNQPQGWIGVISLSIYLSELREQQLLVGRGMFWQPVLLPWSLPTKRGGRHVGQLQRLAARVFVGIFRIGLRPIGPKAS